MRGDATKYEAKSFEELRVRIAMKVGVLSPCIVLLQKSNGAEIKDSDDVNKIFTGATQPYELHCVNNEEAVKRDVDEWEPNV